MYVSVLHTHDAVMRLIWYECDIEDGIHNIMRYIINDYLSFSKLIECAGGRFCYSISIKNGI